MEYNYNDLEESTLSPAPSLSPELVLSYQSLSIEMQQLFVKVYKYLWRVVHAHRFAERGDILSCYYAVDLCRVQHNLTNTQLSLLSYLYQVTNKGIESVHSDMIYNNTVLSGEVLHENMIHRLMELRQAGYISRSTFNPSDPYAFPRPCHPVFISLTLSGVKLIESIERDMYKILLNSSLQDLTGVIKKP